MPKANQIHIDQLLGNVSAKYRNVDYIADKVFPILPVKKSSDKIRVYERNFRIPETIRANRAEAKEHSFDVSNTTYQLVRHALKDFVSDDDAENYDMSSLRTDVTEELTDTILRRKEKTFADLFTTTNWSLNVSLAATAAWNSNSAGSDPIPIVDTACTTVIHNSGKACNVGILPRSGFIAVKNHVSVLDRTKYTSSKMTVEMITGLFDLEELYVPLASVDTSDPGRTTTIEAIYDNNMWLGYKTRSPSLRAETAGYMIQKSVPLVKRWREEARESEAIEVNIQFSPRIISSLSGYIIRDTVQ